MGYAMGSLRKPWLQVAGAQSEAEKKRSATHYTMGLDLGQAADYTAICAVESVESAEGSKAGQRSYSVRHLERPPLGTSYLAVAARVKELLEAEPLKDHTRLVVDATGVGAPVVDMLRQLGLGPVAVYITGGDKVTCEGNAFHVPKRDLVATVQVLLQSGRLKVAPVLALARVLVNELLAFRVTITESAHDVYGGRVGTHDDLVLSVALACWYGERGGYTGRLPEQRGRPALAGLREKVF
jgi:hypothetical protein